MQDGKKQELMIGLRRMRWGESEKQGYLSGSDDMYKHQKSGKGRGRGRGREGEGEGEWEE